MKTVFNALLRIFKFKLVNQSQKPALSRGNRKGMKLLKPKSLFEIMDQKDKDLASILSLIRLDALGIGTRKIKHRLNHRSHLPIGKALRLSLEVEDKATQAKISTYPTRSLKNQEKDALIEDLIIHAMQNNWKVGRQVVRYGNTRDLVFVTIPDGSTLSWLCNLSDYRGIPKCANTWDRIDNFTKIFDMIKKFFPEIIY